jgi:hypothetical protein
MYHQDLHEKIRAALDAKFDELSLQDGQEQSLALCGAAEHHLNHWSKWSNDLGQFKHMIPDAEAALLGVLNNLAVLGDQTFVMLRDEFKKVMTPASASQGRF